jgi:prepilin-type N-terminal cleavage/methylation domain-containing protein
MEPPDGMSVLPRNATPWAQRPGFSLIEALVVLIIISLLAAIAAPRYAQFVARQHVEAAARRIATDLDWARRTAHSVSASRTVTFDGVTHSYSMAGMKNPNHPGVAYRVELGKDPYRTRIVGASFGGDASIVFNGYGAPDSGGSVVIAVGAYQKTISIDAKTGRSTIQ